VKLDEACYPADRSSPVRETTVGGILREAAERAPDDTTMVEGVAAPALERRRWTNAELLADAEAVAAALLGRFEPGERVAAWAPNIPEWVLLEFGAGLAGVVLVTVNPAYRPSELAYVLRQSGAAGIFLVHEFRSPMAAYLEEVRAELPALREAILFTRWKEFLASGSPLEKLPDVAPTDSAQIQYTSGTTGFPKGALLHHRGITNNSRFFAERMRMGPGDVYVNPMPLFHTAGCVMGVLGCLQSGTTHVPVPAFDPAAVLELIESEGGTVLLGVPTMLIAMVEHPDFNRRDLSCVRGVISGGTVVPPELVHRIESDLEAPFTIVFGTTECSPLLTQTDIDDTPEDRATTLGRPLPQTEVKVVDPGRGDVAGVGEVGELCCRGYLVMTGYYDMPEATAAAIDADGWYHTGDLASMDERGYVRIEGRLKDMIIRGGENISPREIEDVLFRHPAVAECAVVGIPDDRWGEVVAAFLRVAPGAARPTETELFALCREHLAPHKTPVHWVFVETFPLTGSGKIQKYVLREQFGHT
jgi:fatty-acyl-CoA synthase